MSSLWNIYLSLEKEQSTSSTSLSQDIFAQFMEIKKKNVGIKAITIFESKVHNAKIAEDYKTPTFYFDLKQVHPIDPIGLHRQTREMLYNTLTN